MSDAELKEMIEILRGLEEVLRAAVAKAERNAAGVQPEAPNLNQHVA